MIDGHIHIERGAYTLDWINQFVSNAVEMEIDEIRLLEHCYRFEEFVPMYDSVCTYSDYVDEWFHRNAGVHKLADKKITSTIIGLYKMMCGVGNCFAFLNNVD